MTLFLLIGILVLAVVFTVIFETAIVMQQRLDNEQK